MIPNHEQNTAVISGDFSRSKFEIAREDAAHIMTILGSTLYSDKIAAVLREYGTNAFDAHVEAGIRDRPISVTLPTPENMMLSIRDHGLGLSHESVFGVFKRFGGSTKRNSNTVAGMLGVGSKSGWAYRNSFTVVSRHGGMCRTYVATAGDAGSPGDISLFAESVCDLDDSGLEIKIAVNHEDIKSFQSRAADVYRNFSPRPIFNIHIEWNDLKYEFETADGAVAPSPSTFDRATRWSAVMGCVTYPINLKQLRISNIADRCTGLIKIAIGDVDVAASRESLKYSDRTIAHLETKIGCLIDAFVADQIKQINSSATTTWQKRLLSQRLNKIGATNAVHRFGNLGAESIKFTAPSGMKVYELTYGNKLRQRSNTALCWLTVDESTHVVLHDTAHALKRHKISYGDVVFVPKNKKNAEHNKQVLLDLINNIGCDGVPFDATSEREIELDSVKPRSKRSRKKVYLLDQKALTKGNKLRDCWIECITEPSDADLYVDIKNFCVEDSKNFYDQCKADAEFAQVYDMPLPQIVGYVSTSSKQKKPIKKIGVSYFEWRKNFYSYVSVHAPKAIQQHVANRFASIYDISATDLNALVARLKDHSDSELVKKVISVMKQVRVMSEVRRSLSWQEERALRLLDQHAKKISDDNIEHLLELKQKLPLLFAHAERLNVLSSHAYRDAWIQYIIDASLKERQ